jgi:hypothetical protein
VRAQVGLERRGVGGRAISEEVRGARRRSRGLSRPVVEGENEERGFDGLQCSSVGGREADKVVAVLCGSLGARSASTTGQTYSCPMCTVRSGEGRDSLVEVGI